MKHIILLFGVLSFFTTKAQYSNYYSIDINQNVNENIKISGNVNVNKNITTIDYGQLSITNAQRERNQLEKLKYNDEREKNISLEIASDPTKAYDYGYQNTFIRKGDDAKSSGFKKYTNNYRIPHKSLFVNAGKGRFENVSIEGITTEIIIGTPKYNTENKVIDIEKDCKIEVYKEGVLNDSPSEAGKKIFVHKKDLNRATVYGIKGFKATLIWEDEYQIFITDTYKSFDVSIGNGVVYSVKVRTYGNKNEVTFEQLEGRRYYLRRLVEKVISTAEVSDMKF
ncbi:MAG: hypothetical protein HXX18_08665 [Bacteroidetes bacterium]|nr:hypothetical protein [Bacteroidota bacterium]